MLFMKPILYNERGIALYLVLWVMALLAIIAGEFCHVIKTEVNITRNFKEETQTYYIATAGVFWTIGQMVVNEMVPRPVKSADTVEEPGDSLRRLNCDISAVPFGDGLFRVEKENESGKVNLNRAGRALLKMMLNNFEIDDAGKDSIVNSIIDWRDKNNRSRLNGAENDYYLSLPEPYQCKNGYFTTADELLLVRGITPAMFHGGLKEMVSVHQDEETNTGNTRSKKKKADFNRININAASPRMLHSLPGMTVEAVREIIEYRKEKDFQSLPELFKLVGSDIYKAISYCRVPLRFSFTARGS